MLAPGLANAVVGAAFGARDVCIPYVADVGGLLEEAFVLRTDVAFAAPGLPNCVLVQECWLQG